MGDLDPHLIPESRDHPNYRSPQLKRQLDRCSRFWQTDRQTDHATRSVRIGRIYVRRTAMRPNNNNIVILLPSGVVLQFSVIFKTVKEKW